MQSGWLLVVGLVMALAEGVPRLSELHWISLLVLRNLQHLLDPLGALVHSSLALFDPHRHIVVQESMRDVLNSLRCKSTPTRLPLTRLTVIGERT